MLDGKYPFKVLYQSACLELHIYRHCSMDRRNIPFSDVYIEQGVLIDTKPQFSRFVKVVLNHPTNFDIPMTESVHVGSTYMPIVLHALPTIVLL